MSKSSFDEAMRKLWTDHVVYTRLYIISAVNGTDDATPTLNRLMKNQEDIGNAVVPYYGSAAGAKLTSLLKQHIAIAGDLVAAAKAGDTAKQNDADRRWHQNAADLATFLSGANPNWPRQAVLDMLNQHLALTTKEAVDRLQKNYSDDIPNYDAIFNQSMMMADTLSSGIEKQFPAKF
ncbi:MAG TPA: glycosyltransferase [Thermoanaerobaculia bacterium]|nr:glycosyltransferase [Thermoanaerobaculia bacterium]